MSDPGKKLSELRVSDLKEELEKRKLETVGAKATLVERLEKALKDEGLDPAKHIFVTNKTDKPKKVQDNKTMPINDEVKVKEEPVDEVPENENVNDDSNNDADDTAVEVDQVGTVDDECIVIEEENEVVDVEPNDNVEANNQDNEESINLTIGEDEQEFLHEEGADDKDKTAELNENQKDKASAKDVKTDRSSNPNKDEKRSGKEEDSTKSKKKDEKSGTDKKDDSDQKSSTKSTQKDDKDKSTNATSNSAIGSAKSESGGKAAPPTRNLWVSGLSALTRASDLKTIFSKYGKVIGAKVVTNTRTPGTRCYGYVTMSSSGDASRCIDHLHRTELHGRIISVERTKNEIGSSSSNTGKDGIKRLDPKRKEDNKTGSSKDSTKGGNDEKRKSDVNKKEDGKKDDKKQSKGDDSSKEKRSDTRERGDNTSSKARSETSSVRRVRDYDRERIQRQRERERERERIRHRELLSYQKIRQERERQRQREREQREEERRRREIRERQRQEEHRLAEERKKLALERERLERQKAELLRLERERQKLERERLELERLELKRQQMKIIQSRDEPVKRVTKRPADDRYNDVPERKRSSGGESRFEAPPPPRFDASLVAPRSYEKKRDEYSTSSSKRGGLDDYTSSSKRMDYSKREEFSTSTKRATIDDYNSISTKRSNEYLPSSKRGGIDDYPSGKRDGPRDEYKREVEIRHIPASGGSNTGSFHSNRDVGGQSIHKSTSNRYGDSDRSSGNYRRSGMDDIRNSSNTNKRYDNAGGYGGNSSNNGVWASSSSHMGHTAGSSGGGAPQLKSYVSNGISSNMHNSSNWQKSAPVDESGWRQMTSNQDRYDRTYNERSSGYPNASSGGGMYASNGRSGPDRYGNTGSSRY